MRLVVVLWILLCFPVQAGLPETVASIKPSIVGVGSYHPSANPRAKFSGTGFVVGDGSLVVTNYHVLPSKMDGAKQERLVIFVGQGKKPKVVDVSVLAKDRVHDLALLKIKGAKLKPLKISGQGVREGQSIAFTGYPIGTILGLYASTHRGIVSAISPIAIPQISSKQLSPRMLKQLKKPYQVYHLDATAYPGNSGSPLYNPNTGAVIGVINKVFIQESKETNAISNPSGITYAIPAKHIKVLMSRQQ
ncbi:S1 family peptidase [Motilimonas pumila]|uniref:Serine protease n=1 Tax=Motilimonas pumila TaxID=2303987 RepID=A0A418YCY7_9GAMM|nr:serine protease [Motilimonas pumila]RJG42366.1 serine protease [Motilimonas pumila]